MLIAHDSPQLTLHPELLGRGNWPCGPGHTLEKAQRGWQILGLTTFFELIFRLAFAILSVVPVFEPKRACGEMVNTGDLKSPGESPVGSSPTTPTTSFNPNSQAQ